MTSGRISKAFLLLIAVTAYISALPLDNPSAPIHDDFTSDYAKRIIRQSKVAEMKGMMNTQIAPCDDFYSYACGNWHRQNPAQLLRNIMTDTFHLISEGFDRRLQRLLQSGQMKSLLEEKVRVFYQSCSQMNRDDVHYKLALRNAYREFGELPVLAGEQWNASDFSWWHTVARIQHKYTKSIIFEVTIMTDIKNKTKNEIYLLPAETDQLSNSRIVDILTKGNEAKKLEHYLGISSKLAKETAEQLQELERKISAGLNRSVISLDEELTLVAVSDLQQTYGSYLNITEFLGLILGEENVPERIYVYSSKSFHNTLKVIQETPPSTLANYILWSLMDGYLIDQRPEQLTKWCIGRTRKYFGKLVDHMIYERYRSAETEAEVHSMWGEIRSVFRQQLTGDKLDWISNKTRGMSIEKLDSMRLLIQSYDNEDFAALFDNVTVDNRNYVANVQEVLMAKARSNLDKLHKPPQPVDAYEISSFTPAYDIIGNAITIPVAFLQPHYLWDSKYPQALKYATLGYLLGHEMIHGFDDASDRTWWDDRSRYEFIERRKCFQAQYHEYKYGGSRLSETADQTENIADNAGVKLVYIAYQRWLEQQTPETVQQETMSGLEVNSRQLFFLGFAQLWCDDVQSLFQSTVATADNHAPSMYRVNGPLSNFQEFSWVYNCSQQARMDPEFKCAIY